MTSNEIRELAKTVGGQCAMHLAKGGSREACQEAAKALNAMADLVEAAIPLQDYTDIAFGSGVITIELKKASDLCDSALAAIEDL